MPPISCGFGQSHSTDWLSRCVAPFAQSFKQATVNSPCEIGGCATVGVNTKACHLVRRFGKQDWAATLPLKRAQPMSDQLRFDRKRRTLVGFHLNGPIIVARVAGYSHNADPSPLSIVECFEL